jgi:phage-related protein
LFKTQRRITPSANPPYALVAVHAMIKKTQKTPSEDLAMTRQGFRELQSWQGKTRT